MLVLLSFVLCAQAQLSPKAVHTLATHYFQQDAPWYEKNIPFLEIDDPEIQDVYYYRWKVFRSHIREIGPEGTTVLEFLPDVPWAREPWTDLNDSSAFHLMEGRWMRDPRTVNSLIEHLYTGGGNTRAFSEWIAAASLDAVNVTGDDTTLRNNFQQMQRIYEQWDDHFDRDRNLYWIEPLADATEYTIASIDASGAGFSEHPSTDPAHNGFTGGYAFRPSINTYQYGNALAIAEIARREGDSGLEQKYRDKAEKLQKATLLQLWNTKLDHFTDRYQRSTEFVKAGEQIRGREMVGYLPWLLELVPRNTAASNVYDIAWSHLLSPQELHGAAGVRTVEPSYPRYMAQYRYEEAKPECEWNGPSWPFQTSQMLTSLANFLDDYPKQNFITATDYLSLLRQYTRQHFYLPGKLDLQEDYDPDQGGPIVGLQRSHHYEHSTYVDLILSGLLGIRPSSDNVLNIAPLLPVSGKNVPRYFSLTGVLYHGHEVAMSYDQLGDHYHQGKGLTIFVDGKRVYGPSVAKHLQIALPKTTSPATRGGQLEPEDLAVNIGTADGPHVTASSSTSEEALKQAIDGRLWFFPEVSNGWTPADDPSHSESWIELTLPRPRTISSVELYFLGAGIYRAPLGIQLQTYKQGAWVEVENQARFPAVLQANGKNTINIPPTTITRLRLLFPPTLPATSFRLVEWKAYEKAQE
ncbi:MAG: discoidin domain-containing protein [Acidobacteriaceae bacterium]|nr:discoidin domain-containing protein [Acidobacteriaceae bacterium]